MRKEENVIYNAETFFPTQISCNLKGLSIAI